MKIKNINKKVFFTTLSLIYTSITCSSCTVSKENSDLISYRDLVDNYRVVEFEAFNKKNLHIVKKEQIDDMENCYGYYDVLYNDCIVKVNMEKGTIIGKGIITNIAEMNIDGYLNMYHIKQATFSKEDLGTIIEIIRNDYFDTEKVLVK